MKKYYTLVVILMSFVVSAEERFSVDALLTKEQVKSFNGASESLNKELDDTKLYEEIIKLMNHGVLERKKTTLKQVYKLFKRQQNRLGIQRNGNILQIQLNLKVKHAIMRPYIGGQILNGLSTWSFNMTFTNGLLEEYYLTN